MINKLGSFYIYYNCVDFLCPSLIEVMIVTPSNDLRAIYSCNQCGAGSYPYNYMGLGVFEGGVQYKAKKCRPCPVECLTCDNSTYCYTCDEGAGYWLDTLNSCKTCNQIHSINCLTCNSTHCLSCSDTYCLDFTNRNNLIYNIQHQTASISV